MRGADLADGEDLEGRAEFAGDFEGHRDAAARQPEDHGVVQALAALQVPGQGPACGAPVGEHGLAHAPEVPVRRVRQTLGGL
jgi:hypothetical protein